MIKFDKLTLYTIEEAAEIVHLSYTTIRKYLKAGRIKGQKVASRWYVSEEDLKRFTLGEVDTPSVVSSNTGDEVK